MSHTKRTLFSLFFVLASMTVASCATIENPNSFERNRDPDKSLKTYVTLGTRYLQQGEMEDASRTLMKARDIDPDNPQVNNALALFYTIEGEPEQVEKHYQKALDEDPDFSSARNNYAAFLFAQKKYQKALKQLKIVAKDYRYPRRFQSFENMGLCYLKLGDEKQAEKALQRALQLNPRLPKAQLEMAAISFKKQDYQAANFYFSQLNRMKVKPTPRKLWLEIQLNRVLGNKNKLASLELALKNLFPNSREYQLLTASKNQGGANP